jgi:hypothetical protein
MKILHDLIFVFHVYYTIGNINKENYDNKLGIKEINIIKSL